MGRGEHTTLLQQTPGQAMLNALTGGAKPEGTVVVRCMRVRGNDAGVGVDTRLRSGALVENLIMGSTMISFIHPFSLKKSTLLSGRGAKQGSSGETLDVYPK